MQRKNNLNLGHNVRSATGFTLGSCDGGVAAGGGRYSTTERRVAILKNCKSYAIKSKDLRYY